MNNQNAMCNHQTQTDADIETRPSFAPEVDIHETDSEFVLTADLPGATTESIDVHFDDGVLTLRASVPPRTAPDARFVQREYRVGDYARRFRLGEDIDPDAISASYSDGVLTLTLPKKAVAQRRKIEIKAG